MILMTIVGCNSTKELTIKENFIIDNQIDSIKLVTLDTMNYQVIDTVLRNELLPVYTVDKLEREVIHKDNPKETPKENKVVKENNDNVIIEDRTNNQTIESEAGTMAYSVPEDMQVGKSYQVKLRISRDGNKVQLVNGDRNITIYDKTVKSKVVIESIRVESIMSAQLLSDSDKFQITPLSTELQNIEEKGYTEWDWSIKPLKGGQNFLKLVVKVRIKEDGQEFYKDITVFDKNIDVKSNPGFTISQFIQSYWQWIMTTIIIPLVIWWWKNRKEKKKPSRKSK